MTLKLLSSLFIGASVLALSVQAQTFSKKFSFGASQTKANVAQVQASDVYSKEKGYGFEPRANVICSEQDSKKKTGACGSDAPFYFSAAVPEGNYKVTVTFGDKNNATEMTVKAELRRLMLEKVTTEKGKSKTESFIVSVRTPQYPGGEVKLKDREKTMEWRAWDDKLTLEFNGKRPTISAIEIERVNVPTIFLLGDSTVCDQPREPYASWGQMLTRFFNSKVAVANHAESGESLRSSLGAKRLDKVLSLMKPGDYFLIQYGHNDEKEKGDGVGAFTTYKASLKKFVEEARKKGGMPVLITPMHRRTFDAAGKITNSHGDYPEAVRQAAREEKVPLIDLNVMSKEFYEALGKEKSGVAFKEGDGTHHNNYGSYEFARMIVEGVKANKLSITKYLVPGIAKYDPNKPDAPESFNLPASPLTTETKPLGN